jgi:hypothetical protein
MQYQPIERLCRWEACLNLPGAQIGSSGGRAEAPPKLWWRPRSGALPVALSQDRLSSTPMRDGEVNLLDEFETFGYLVLCEARRTLVLEASHVRLLKPT